MKTFYAHPDAQQRERQKTARSKALAAVKAGAIRWGKTNIGTTGFVYTVATARIEQLDGLELLIGLFELRNAGKIRVNELTGAVTA
ncbi:hypothetical protein ACIRG5_42530 [Lentzea sp. NPDC102401]|uniref:hypothetical protein n=1 Tax=Lentzea sp. NPDC102401 TaxID=3364128 RepID=UPI00381C30E6